MGHVDYYKVGDRVLVKAGDSESSRLLNGRICTVIKSSPGVSVLREEISLRGDQGPGGVHNRELTLVEQKEWD